MKDMIHYYGDVVRRLFLLGAFVMALTYPFFCPLVLGPSYVPIMAIIILGIAAGVTNPRQTWVAVLDLLISVFAVALFEYHSVYAYREFSAWDYFFWTNQFLALIFLIALYYSVKTLRGKLMSVRDKASFEEV